MAQDNTQRRQTADPAGDDAALEALCRERDEAVAAREAALDMLATFAHELRTPLTGILGMANLLLGAGLGEDSDHYARTIWDTGNHLSRLVDDVVDLSLLESDGFRLAPQPACPADIVRGVLDIVGPEAGKKRIALSWQIDGELEDSFVLDAARLRQVLLNLAANAIRYTDAGTVRIEAAFLSDSPQGTRAAFTVTDTGIGMSDETVSGLFTRFMRAGPPDRRGAGLGLAISRHVVELMGGAIAVDSALGKGSRFLVTLPLLASGEPADAGPEDPKEQTPETPVSLDLLLAEDDDLNQIYFETLLRAGGHRVTVVANGREALEAVRQRDFDAVLMDIQMPVMNGSDATHAIRALPGDKAEVPVIAMSGGIDMRGMAEYQSAGFTGFLTKPVDNQALARALTDATGRPASIPDYSLPALDVPPPSEDAGHAVEAFLDGTDALGREQT